jgi:hypothetical protein
MKTLKITLAVIVVAAITIAIIWGFMSVGDSGEIELAQKSGSKAIEQKIDSLKKMPNSSFCDSFYKEIKYYIDDDYSLNRLGNNQSENDQWKKNLSSNLYAAYTDKFIQQAFYVFKGSEWDEQKLDFIRSEYQMLQKDGIQTGMLEKNSNTDGKLNEIRNILLKYSEIRDFINSCKGFNVPNPTILETQFPISIVQANIIRSEEYLKNDLGNDYVKNCMRLKTNLSEVPQYLFKAHVKYLDDKISYWEGGYRTTGGSQPIYSQDIYLPVLEEIEQLDNNIYNIDNFSTEYNELKDKWEKEGEKAYYYFK